MAFFRHQNSAVEKAAMALAAAGGVAHAAFFTLFAWRVIGRGGFSSVGWALLALIAAVGVGLNFVGYWLIRRGKTWRKWGFMSIALSSVLAGALLGIASWVA